MSLGVFHSYFSFAQRARRTTKNTSRHQGMRYGLLLASLSLSGITQAAGLDTKLPSTTPSNESSTFISTHDVNLPEAPLAASLQRYETLSQTHIKFDSALVVGKMAPAVKGRLTVKETLNRLLVGSDLAADIQGNHVTIKAASKTKNDGPNITLETTQIRAKRFYEVGPMPGLALTKDEIPGNVQSISAKEIKEAHALSLTDLMNSKLQSVNVNDYQSNPFQMDVTYRGFTASPQLGTAQGISVFLDGIRVNEPFGDVVNWDMIPLNALKGLDVFPGSNPVFGLGTLGGALAMRTKSGFDGKSVDAEVLTGSFGRKQLQVSAGNNNGVVAGFISGNFFLEDGWRKDSPSKVNQVFGKTEWRNDSLQLGLSMLYAGNKLVGNGLLPTQMVDQNPSQVYTSPDQSKNDLLQFQLSGQWDVSDTFNITGQLYNRKSKRKAHTSDVNENFGGADARPNPATTRDRTRQQLPGYQDINRDGLPDYNNFAMNVAADANGNALDVNGNSAIIDDGNGNFIDNPAFDVNNLAIGTNFNTRANANQATVTAQDGSGNTILNWTYDPRSTLYGNTLPSLVPGQFNAPVTAAFENLVRFSFNNAGILNFTVDKFYQTAGIQNVATTLHPGSGSSSFEFSYADCICPQTGQYTDNQGFFHSYYQLLPVSDVQLGGLGSTGVTLIAPTLFDANNNFIYRDGKNGYLKNTLSSGPSFSEAGYIDGTPTAIFNDTTIDQLGKGGAVQLNWNLDQHKFMVGGSYDTSDSKYASKQYLGFLDANRHGYTDPLNLGWEYYANDAAHGYALNDFQGDSTTKSLYASETWSPIKTLNITAAARYNFTVVNNKLDVNKISSFGDVNRILNLINPIELCTDQNNNGVVEASECPTGIDGHIVPYDPIYGYLNEFGQNLTTLQAGEQERFKYRSFNPSLGVTWQAREDLNLYGNVGRGARTPTTIELGCAYDATPVQLGIDKSGKPVTQPRSIFEQRNCTLPGALSGDPYLKQVRSTSMEVGGAWLANPRY